MLLDVNAHTIFLLHLFRLRLAVFAGSHAVLQAEEAVEAAAVVEAGFVHDFVYGMLGGE